MLKATPAQIKTINELADQYQFPADAPAHKDKVFRLALIFESQQTTVKVQHRRMNVYDAAKFIEWARLQVQRQAR